MIFSVYMQEPYSASSEGGRMPQIKASASYSCRRSFSVWRPVRWAGYRRVSRGASSDGLDTKTRRQPAPSPAARTSVCRRVCSSRVKAPQTDTAVSPARVPARASRSDILGYAPSWAGIFCWVDVVIAFSSSRFGRRVAVLIRPRGR